MLFASKIKNLNPELVQYKDSSTQTTGDSEDQLHTFGHRQSYSCPLGKDGRFDHSRNVDKLMSELLLLDCANTLVTSCSGGEQKRLCFAQELVAQIKPNLLCIDEPSSGLDSNAAEVVIQCLQSLAERHQMAIITSIHQPNSLILNMFDQLYLLSMGGHCVFFGQPNNLKQYLTDNGIECPEEVHPIELMLKISSKYPTKLGYLSNTKVWNALNKDQE